MSRSAKPAISVSMPQSRCEASVAAAPVPSAVPPRRAASFGACTPSTLTRTPSCGARTRTVPSASGITANSGRTRRCCLPAAVTDAPRAGGPRRVGGPQRAPRPRRCACAPLRSVALCHRARARRRGGARSGRRMVEAAAGARYFEVFDHAAAVGRFISHGRLL